MIKRLASASIKQVIRVLTYGAVGAFLMAIVVFVLYTNSQPDLSVWHHAELASEFTVDSDVESFAQYLELEERLFAELDEEVYGRVQPAEQFEFSRYTLGSMSDPTRWPRNWNRSFELPQQEPEVGVLLLHGMSDSPYSMRGLAQHLHEAGAWVVGLRIPGHGTAPVGLTRATWPDMAEAVRIAAVHLRERVGDRPFYMVGYSNGASLAVNHSLESLEDETYPRPEGIALLSPAIGVVPEAAFAVWQARLGRLLGLDKLAWTSVLPEYDPYKYQSFAVNAGEQVYNLTSRIKERMERGGIEEFPSVLAFQSAVDATVSVDATIKYLMQRLPDGDHELVIFDCDRTAGLEPLLTPGVRSRLKGLLLAGPRRFTLAVVENADEHSREVVLRRLEPDASEVTLTSLGESWPAGVYSLSHVALPFPPDDPVYGGPDAGESPGVQIGNIAMRGERGALRIPASDLMRMRWNPFFDYMSGRVSEFFVLDP